MSEELYIKKDKPVGVMHHTRNESLLIFDECNLSGKTYKLFYGIGKVYRVVKGDKCDLLYINFGLAHEHPRRLVVVYDNHSRRQLLTVKRGQIAQIYGICKYYSKEVINRNGNKKRKAALGLYAFGINGWYVPTLVDIKKMPINDHVVSPTKAEKEYLESRVDILDQFLFEDIKENEEDDE